MNLHVLGRTGGSFCKDLRSHRTVRIPTSTESYRMEEFLVSLPSNKEMTVDHWAVVVP